MNVGDTVRLTRELPTFAHPMIESVIAPPTIPIGARGKIVTFYDTALCIVRFESGFDIVCVKSELELVK